MDMATFKTLEFAAIFGALGYFWWNQRQSRLRAEQAEREQSEAETSSSPTSGQSNDGTGA